MKIGDIIVYYPIVRCRITMPDYHPGQRCKIRAYLKPLDAYMVDLLDHVKTNPHDTGCRLVKSEILKINFI